MHSRFLPSDFDLDKPIAVIAGKYQYPLIMIEKMQAAGVPVRLIAFKNETLPELIDRFPENERAVIKVGQLGHMLSALKKFKAAYAVMAGQVTPGRLFKDLHPDLKAVAILATLKEKNADTIFGAIAREIEKIGIQQLDARVFMDTELADLGVMSFPKYSIKPESLEHGIRIVKTIAREDIGQGAVVSRGTVLAIEAFEGTDSMLKRAGSFGAKDSLFVKTVKPQQDYRFDVPVFGMTTLEHMHQAGISAAALEAGNVLILQKEQLLREAKHYGIHIFGFEA